MSTGGNSTVLARHSFEESYDEREQVMLTIPASA